MFLNKYFTVSIKKLFDAFNSKRCQHYSPDVGINIAHNEHLSNHLMMDIQYTKHCEDRPFPVNIHNICKRHIE